MGLFNQNVFRLIKPIIKDDQSRSCFARIIFNILKENRGEGNLASTIRDPMGPLAVGFTQVIFFLKIWDERRNLKLDFLAKPKSLN